MNMDLTGHRRNRPLVTGAQGGHPAAGPAGRPRESPQIVYKNGAFCVQVGASRQRIILTRPLGRARAYAPVARAIRDDLARWGKKSLVF
jgi:hypothetical protein